MRKLLPFFFFLLLALPSCLNSQEFSEEELQALVDSELERKINDFRRIKLERCREDMLERANFIVDSLRFRQTQQQVDSLFLNNNRVKPGRPDLRTVPDEWPVAPLFDTIRLDSLPEKK